MSTRQQHHFHNCYPGELEDCILRITQDIYKFCPYPEAKEMMATALLRQGLRYDEMRDELVYSSRHGMTTRSHIIPHDIRSELEYHIDICGLADVLDKLRENITEICYIKENGTVRRIQCILLNHIADSGSTVRLEKGHYTAWCQVECQTCYNVPLIQRDKLRVWDVEQEVYRILWLGSILTVDQEFFFL